MSDLTNKLAIIQQIKKFCDAFGIKTVEEMLSNQFDKAMSQLNRKLKDASN
jgi:hypothetical protein